MSISRFGLKRFYPMLRVFLLEIKICKICTIFINYLEILITTLLKLMWFKKKNNYADLYWFLAYTHLGNPPEFFGGKRI